MSVSVEKFTTLENRMDAMMSMMEKLMNASAPSASAPASGKSGKAKKERKAKDPSAPKRPPTAWALLCASLTPRVTALYKSMFADEKVPRGLHMSVCGLLKTRSQAESATDANISDAISFLRENPDYKSNTQTTRAAKSVASDTGSVASAAAPSEKPKRVLSDEQKQKMAEGRARKAAEKKAAAAASAPVAPVASAPVAAPVAAAPVVPSVAAVVDSSEWKGVFLKGKRYLYNPSNNHCYHREADGSQGDWAGIINIASKSIDDSVPEPVDDDEELDLDDE